MMQIRSIAKKAMQEAFATVGLEVRSLPKRRSQRDQTESKTSGMKLEVFGFSGVGKTTLYKRIYPEIRDIWIPSAELIRDKDLIQATQSTLDRDIATFYDKMLRTKVTKILAAEYPIAKKVHLVAYHVTLLERSLSLEQLILPKGIFIDEGLLRGFQYQMVEAMEEDSCNLECILKNRSIIYLYSDPEFALRNIKNRRSDDGPINWGSHPDSTDSEIMDLIDQGNHVGRRLIDLLQERGVRVLSISQSDGFEKNVAKAITFARSLAE